MAVKTPTKTTAHADTHNPVMNVTRFDHVSSWMIAAVLALGAAVVWLTVVWATNRLPAPKSAVPVEMINLSGGAEDGSPDETLQLESPEEETEDPTIAETESEETEIQEVLETVVELADQATDQAEQQFETDASNAGKPGSASGTGKRALGLGPGEGGIPREQRWFIRFADGGSLDAYAKQLAFFGIELGALRLSGKLDYISDVAAKKPKVRSATSGKGENRLYMTWRGGNRRTSDIKLFERAGSYVGQALILHFYPPKTEALLAHSEHAYKNRDAQEIRRTYFTVRPGGDGYLFVVTKQTYF